MADQNPFKAPQAKPDGEMLSGEKVTAPGVVPRLSIMMFLQFFVWGAWYVAVGGFLKDNGMSDYIAAAYTVAPIAAILAPLTIGLIADRLMNSEIVLAILFLLGAVLLWVAPSLASPSSGPSWFTQFTHPMILCLLLYMLCFMPTLGLTASLSFSHLGNGEKEFPVVRVLGTIGWIAGGWVMWLCRLVTGESTTLADAQSALIEATNSADMAAIESATASLQKVTESLTYGDNSGYIFYAAAIASAILGVYCLTLPKTAPPSKGEPMSVEKIFGFDAWSMLAQPSFLVFAVASFLICIPLAGYYSSGYNFVSATSVNLFGTANGAMSTGQMSEIFFMLVMPLFFARLGVKNMLAIGMAAWVLRYLVWGYAFGQTTTLMIWVPVFLGILLHGICYDFFFVTGMIYTDKKAPQAIRGQAQALIVMLTQGFGLGIGAQLFGFWLKRCTTGTGEDAVVDYAWFWYVPAGFAAVVLVFFVTTFWDKTKEED